MAQGTITRLSIHGFGFIDHGTGKDLFFHESELAGVAFENLRTGDIVEFDLAHGPPGRDDEAVHVSRIER
jgi:CspA family cold shock protein